MVVLFYFFKSQIYITMLPEDAECILNTEDLDIPDNNHVFFHVHIPDPFKPTYKQLIEEYLVPRKAREPLRTTFITEADMYRFNPIELTRAGVKRRRVETGAE
ncbi:hypothetical protein I3760_10G129500 [Carya illinoinensis]|nr:hypothetical protein I3760_10G129500 [Carya illinoinensis]